MSEQPVSEQPVSEQPVSEQPVRTLYGESHRALQDRFDTRPLADTMEAVIVRQTISDEDQTFIESRDSFYLSTVDGDGWPTVSYKGGPVGVLRVEDPSTIVFPSYDGNGMYLSLGNLAADDRVGLLLIGFETPRRLRIQARATIDDSADRLRHFPGAQTTVVLHVEKLFPNCARYIHPHQRIDASPYVPDGAGMAPIPSWKRIDAIQPVLPDADRTAIGGETITAEEYAARLADGTS